MPDPLGPDIRALRKARGMTLQELADRLDRSVGWLSQVERGQSTPAIPDLSRIAGLFGTTISFFFRATDAAPGEAGLIQRAAARTALGSPAAGLTEELLSPTLGGGFEMLVSTFAPGTRTGPHPANPEREDGGMVVAGRLMLTIGAQEFDLGPGDSFQFKCQPYACLNPGAVPAVVLWVIAPPVY